MSSNSKPKTSAGGVTKQAHSQQSEAPKTGKAKEIQKSKPNMVVRGGGNGAITNNYYFGGNINGSGNQNTGSTSFKITSAKPKSAKTTSAGTGFLD